MEASECVGACVWMCGSVCGGVKMGGDMCMWMYEEVYMCRGEVDMSVDVCMEVWISV